MYHDPTLAAQAKADPRPRSAVSTGAGLAGLAGVLTWIAIARYAGMDGPYSALVNMLFCGVPMIAWSLAVDKVHRAASTGLDWTAPRRWVDVLDGSVTKLVGFWATWAAIAAIYATERFYWQGNFQFAMWCIGLAAPAVVALSIPYVLWIDRYLVEPRDAVWHFGAWLTGQAGVAPEKIHQHLRTWGVKTFFIAFMLAAMPGGFGDFVRRPLGVVLHDPVALASWLITFMFVIDMVFATVGYVLTFRPLDSHIRTANPYAAAWMAALICYPPVILMSDGGPLDYFPGTRGTDGWTIWFAGHPWLLATWGAILVGLTGVYAWATVAFGFRFSNLTHRGILTHGPYAYSRHPAYLAKNLFWWLSVLPVLTVGSHLDAFRAVMLMSAVSGVYYWRARTEERHLGLDPVYRDYSAWMARRGLVPRAFAAVFRRGVA